MASFVLRAQEDEANTESSNDSIHNEYIIDHKKQLNIKIEVGNDISSYQLEDGDLAFEFKPNLNLRYGLVFSYKFLSVRVGIRPKESEKSIEEKGGTDSFRLRFQLLFERWNHVFEYHIDKGYYVANTSEFSQNYDGVRLQFPEMKTHLFMGSSVYRFNKNYSVRATQSQTEIQAKSAGSFMPGISYNYYSIDGLNTVQNLEGEREYRDRYKSFKGINLAFVAGYYYTLVLKENWFLNGYVNPNVGIDIYQTDSNSPNGTYTINSYDFFAAMTYGVGGGYNGKKFFFGGKYSNRVTTEEFTSNKFQLVPASHQFSVYFGYRFKAPKPISAPVDLIEKKVPILQDKTN